MLEMIPTFVWYALLGASIREVWGIWRAYETFLDVKLAWKRIAITWGFAWFFGSIGGLILTNFGIFPLGAELAALFAGILSGNSINFLAKKLGFAQKMEVPVCKEQIQTDLKPRQVNALQVAKKEGRITTQVQQRVGTVTRRAAQYDLQKLVDRGMLRQRGHGRGAYYVPKNAH